MKTPAYPSGHSLQSRLIAEYYAKKYPEHKTELIDRADECGKQRIYDVALSIRSYRIS